MNGVTFCTRLLGCSYLFPHVIPDPHVETTMLHPEDQLVIMANQGLWKFMSYQDAVNEVIGIPDPVVAAKRLQDLAQGYGSQENIAVLVVRLLLTDAERFRIKNILQSEFEAEQIILTQLKSKDRIREENKKKRVSAQLEEQVPMDIVKLKATKRHTHMNEIFSMDNTANRVQVNPLEKMQDREEEVTDWELALQKRLTEEVKNKELKYVFLNNNKQRMELESCPEEPESNWSTLSRDGEDLRISETQSWVESNRYHAPLPSACAGPPLNGSADSLAFIKELKMPIQVDRDAILFHEMQMARARNHSNSCDSMDSTQSEQVFASARHNLGGRISSHSIEVLIHNPNAKTEASFGGSFPDNGTIEKSKPAAKVQHVGGSCPFTISPDMKCFDTETNSNDTQQTSASNYENGKNKKQIVEEQEQLSVVEEKESFSSQVKSEPSTENQAHSHEAAYESSNSDIESSEHEIGYVLFPEKRLVVADVHKHKDSSKETATSLEELLTVGLQQASENSKVLMNDKSKSSSTSTLSSTKSLSQQSVIITYL